MNRSCVYFVEGECEKQLIMALHHAPAKLIKGKIKVINVIQELIPKSHLLTIKPNSLVVLVFDTDVTITTFLERNINLIKDKCVNPKIIFLPQVLNLEDELIRCTNINRINELTKSKSISNFKKDFCKLKAINCRSILERHHLLYSQLWMTKVPSSFSFVYNNANEIMVE